ncbi:MAG TPA: 3'-5' exonuclease [Syntrophales bacterium]|nr:3'-5' exonuclease [Syntrophales bacterium]
MKPGARNKRWGVPFEIRSSIRFFEQAHVKDVIAYLRIIANPGDELAWKRALGLYSRIGKATAGKIWAFISRHRGSLTELMSNGSWTRNDDVPPITANPICFLLRIPI